MNDASTGVLLERRLIPFPTSVSAPTRNALRGLVGADGVPLNSLHSLPAPDDPDAWLARKTAVAANYAAKINEAAGTLKSNADAIVTSGATVHFATPKDVVRPDCAYIDLHRGVLVLGRGEGCRAGVGVQADLPKMRSYGAHYRTPPEFQMKFAASSPVNGDASDARRPKPSEFLHAYKKEQS